MGGLLNATFGNAVELIVCLNLDYGLFLLTAA
jgi:Ca2+/H+ antiporter